MQDQVIKDILTEDDFQNLKKMAENYKCDNVEDFIKLLARAKQEKNYISIRFTPDEKEKVVRALETKDNIQKYIKYCYEKVLENQVLEHESFEDILQNTEKLNARYSYRTESKEEHEKIIRVANTYKISQSNFLRFCILRDIEKNK